MITAEQHRRIEQLLDEGQLTQLQIAQATGVGRSTVHRIASGRWQRYFNPVDEPPAKPPVRCAGCGGLVYLPCQLCRLRSWQQRRAAWRRRLSRASGAGRRRRAHCCGRKAKLPESG